MQIASGWIAIRREPLNIPDIVAGERFGARAWAKSHGLGTAMNGVLGLAEEPFLLVLLDAQMPDTDGFALAPRISRSLR